MGRRRTPKQQQIQGIPSQILEPPVPPILGHQEGDKERRRDPNGVPCNGPDGGAGSAWSHCEVLAINFVENSVGAHTSLGEMGNTKLERRHSY